MRGRRAALPAGGWEPPPRLLVDGERCVVRFATEDGRASREFDFARLPVERALQVAFARAFDRVTGPSGTRKAMASADKTYQALRVFGQSLARLPVPPRRPEELRASHLDQYALQRRHHQSFNREFSALKGVLRAVDGLGERFVAKLVQPNPHRHRPRPLRSYSQAEFRRILAAARHDAHAAAVRIRANRRILADWRGGRVDRDADPAGWELGLVLDEIERTGDVPRYPRGPRHARWFVHRHGTVPQLMGRIHLMWEEAAAFLVLLIGLTGHNGGTLGDVPAVHHRPDGQAGGTASAIVELRKPRRGKHRSHLPTALVDLSDPVASVVGEPPGEVPARDELHTPFGIYRLLLELTEPARRLVGTDRLLVCWAPKGFSRGPGFRVGVTPSMVPVWGRRRQLPADPDPQHPDAPPGLLSVTMPRLRLSYLQHRQKAVAHTDRVLATEYLGRDRGNLVDYQRVVARVLDEQVARAKAGALVATLNAADLAEARHDPAAVAARFGLTPAALRRLLEGELDTVLAACVDHINSPHAPAGEPCRASFLRCLDCPCARATPAHLPVQTLVLDALEARRAELAPLAWAQRFALPHTQLSEVLSRFSPAVVDAARATVSEADRRLVERLLSRELDWT